MMYEQINRELEALEQGIYRCRKIDAMLNDLAGQLGSQEKRLAQLRSEMDKESLDVEKLEKMGLSAMFYTILGSREKQIEKERQEALAAQLKYGDMKRQIEDTKRRISQLRSERTEFEDCESKYNQLFDEKYTMLTEKNQDLAKKIFDSENKISLYKANLKEIIEAVSAGKRVLSGLDRVDESLNSAEGWGMWDMWGGRGLLTNMAKHSHIDDARNAASDVQLLLNRFKTELADVKISSQITIDIGGFVRFADFFFDGLIADWVVQARIHDSQDSVSRVRAEVGSVLGKLRRMQDHDEQELSKLEQELDAMIKNA